MRTFIIAAAALGLATASFAAGGRITAVTWTKAGAGLKVELKGTDLAQPSILHAKNGKSYTLEFDASFRGKARREEVNYAGVSYIESGTYSNKPVRSRVQ